jgi:hypothetical protein
VLQSPSCLDGKLVDPTWLHASQATIRLTNLGDSANEQTQVLLGYDKDNLYVGIRAFEFDMGSIKGTVTTHNGPVFKDDSVEIFLDPKGDGKDYFHLAANVLGTTFQQRDTSIAWSADWVAVTGRESNAWTAEIAIPFSALKTTAPSNGTVWRANFCRNRVASRTQETTCWSATYGSYHTPARFGRLIFDRAN